MLRLTLQQRKTHSPAVRVQLAANRGGGLRRFSSERSTQHDILAAALLHVPKYGWSVEALSLGAVDRQLSPAAQGLAGTPLDLVLHFVDSCNHKLIEKCLQDPVFAQQISQAVPKERLQLILRERLSYIQPLLSTWSQALSILAYPAHLPRSVPAFATTIDEVCYRAGDRSTQFDWYAKRAAVGMIYSATELHMLTDGSPRLQSTWEFLDRRINDLAYSSKFTNEIAMGAELLAKSSLTMAASLFQSLGVNSKPQNPK